jgi:hypothetical protein
MADNPTELGGSGATVPQIIQLYLAPANQAIGYKRDRDDTEQECQ